VGYAKLPHDCATGSDGADDCESVLKRLPRGAIAMLLRLVMQEGFQRIIIHGENPRNIALAAEVARLASQRMTVLGSAPNTLPGWLSKQSHIDFVKAPVADQ